MKALEMNDLIFQSIIFIISPDKNKYYICAIKHLPIPG